MHMSTHTPHINQDTFKIVSVSTHISGDISAIYGSSSVSIVSEIGKYS